MHHHNPPYKTFNILGFKSSEIEVRDLVKSWAAISLAFAILLGGLDFSINFLFNFLMSGITVGSAFLLHELGHKLVAQKYGCFAEYRSFDKMLLLAIAMSFFGFIFAAPGAVMIAGRVNHIKNGKISAAGPLVNIALAIIFLFAYFSSPLTIFKYGFFINAWIGLFNMIPLWNFDGKKIWKWNKTVYIMMVAVSLSFLFMISL